MICANHPEKNAVAYCRECGKPMCEECRRPALGSVYCAEHLPVTAPPLPNEVRQPPPLPEQPGAASSQAGSYQSSPYSAPASAYTPPSGYTTPASPYSVPEGVVADPSVHPVLALILGFLPGVGAIYNGQYAKGLVHAVIFGLLISLISNSQNGGMAAFLGIAIGVWVVYQAFEAYHTARKRRYGLTVEEFSSLFEVHQTNGRFPVGALLLIGVGFILLLDTTDIISMERFERYWPLLLIGIGVYMLYARLNPASGTDKGSVSNGGVRR
jgi:TM2 domain-containing membrane protein YozV